MNLSFSAARCALLSLVVLVVSSALGCTQLADPSLPQTTVFPKSDSGAYIQDLYNLVFSMAVVVFVGVQGFLLYTIIRFRRRREDEMPAQVHGNTGLEMAWTIIPSIVLLVIAVPSISTIFAADAVPQTVTQRVKVTGHQWWWEFEYPDLGIVTANELHLPVGETVRVDVASKDVVHSFWIPQMGGKVDVFPGRSMHMWFTPHEAGEYYGQCVEFCGVQHANMRMRLFVDTRADFDAWVQRQRADAAQPRSALATRGADLFARSACIACHTIKGTNAQGVIGPNLTHVAGRKTIGAGIMDNTPQNLARWIRDPQGVKVGNKMIQVPMSEGDLNAIVAYLRELN